MTETLRKTLRDSKVARWSALAIVSFTMMIAYFFTDVMGPLEAPLTTSGQIVYLEDGTYLSADSLSKIAVDSDFTIESIKKGAQFTISITDESGNAETKVCVVNSIVKGLGWTSSEYGIFSGAYGYINVFLLMLLLDD